MSDYYIIESDGSRNGPHGLVDMVKKVRSGKVLASTEVYVIKEDRSFCADALPELKEFFADGGSATISPAEFDRAAPEHEAIHLIPLIKEAAAFLSTRQHMAVMSGAFMLGAIIMTLVSGIILPSILVAVFGTVVGGFSFFMLLTATLTVVRNHPVDGRFMSDLMQYHFKPLFIASAITAGMAFGLPAIIGATISNIGYLLMMLGLIPFSLFIFTPFILADDPSLSYKEAMMLSKSWVKAQGMDDMGALVGLLFINAIGVLCFFLPVFITLPITCIALADLYEQRVSKAR